MWSRTFLSVGLLSGSVIALPALACMMLTAPFPYPPRWTVAASIDFAIYYASVGLVIYLVCWYAIIVRTRSYSVARTWRLVGGTFLAYCSLVLVITLGYFSHLAMQAPTCEGLTLAGITSTQQPLAERSLTRCR